MDYKRVFVENSFVFVTVVTSNQRCILIDNVDLLRNSFEHAKKFYSFEIFAAVILPEHFHMVIKPDKIIDYPTIVRLIKSYFSKHIDIKSIQDYELSSSRKNKKEKDIWQRRYWEHTIVDEQDLCNHIDYIHFNPVKHDYVHSVKDWEYSSFNKFVKAGYYVPEWGSSQDIEKIQKMEYE